MMQGGAGIGKAILRRDRASQEVIALRTEICRGCQQAQILAGVLRRCKLCGCATWAKVRNGGEKCPVGKW